MVAGGYGDATARRGAAIRPIAVAKMNGDWARGNYRLAPISPGGTVWCVNIDTAEPIECVFTAASGAWIDGADDRRYALVGQAITRDGVPGGECVVAARIDDDGRVPGLHAGFLDDAAGTPVGCELSGGAVIETMLSPRNAFGRPVQHYCRLPVPTTSLPHPDGAELVGPDEGPVRTFIGIGAALNDINGHEADINRQYLVGAGFTHVVWSGGFEIPAAKRPAVRTFPAPATIRGDTPIVWRPVANTVMIGSDLGASGCP